MHDILVICYDGRFYLWRKTEYMGKTLDRQQIVDTGYYIAFYRVHLPISGNLHFVL